VGAEKIHRGCDEGIVHLVVLEEITRDEKGVGLVLDR
jgi:hypothetical protein